MNIITLELIVKLIILASELQSLGLAEKLLLCRLIAMTTSYDQKQGVLIAHAMPKKLAMQLGITRRYYSLLVEKLRENGFIQTYNYGNSSVVYRINIRSIEVSESDKNYPGKVFGSEDVDPYRNT